MAEFSGGKGFESDRRSTKGRKTRPIGQTIDVPDDFDAITLDQAKSLLPDLEDAVWNWDFIHGDHWQNGDGWIGPGPRSGDQGYSDFLTLLEPSFTSKNVCDEVCDRQSSAVIGWEPRFAWAPIRQVSKNKPVTQEESDAIAEIETAQTQIWNRRKMHQTFKKLAYQLLWAQESVLRLYVPAGFVDKNGNPRRPRDLREALSMVYIDVPEPTSATVWEHPDTKELLGIYIFKDSKGVERAELTYIKSGKTVVRITPEPITGPAIGSGMFGGNLTMWKAALESPLITEQVRSLQKQYNMTLTLLSKGLIDNHFLEKMFFNALPPGRWVYEKDNKTRKAYIVEPRRVGGRTDTYFQGVDYTDKDGKTHLSTPSALIRTPLDPQGTIRGSEYWYQCLLEECRQDHILINQLATPSGKSRDSSRGDFIDSTKDTQAEVEQAGRAVLLTMLAMAEALLGTPGKYTDRFQPIFKCRPNYGPLTVEERRQNVEEAEKGFLSYETTMALNGTDDVNTEKAFIDQQPSKALALSDRRADVADKWALIFPREVALHLAGFTDEEITDLMDRLAKAQAKQASVDPQEFIDITANPQLNAGGGDVSKPPTPRQVTSGSKPKQIGSGSKPAASA